MYDLFAVVEHVGRRMDGGHYIAYVRGKDSEGGDVWWKCNDGKCWMVNPEMVSAAQGYLWFYERQTQRGRTPEEWGVDGTAEVGEDGREAGLPTPESEEKGILQDHKDEDKNAMKRDGSWEGRING